MMLINFNKKESPIQGLVGFGGGLTRFDVGAEAPESAWLLVYGWSTAGYDPDTSIGYGIDFDSSDNIYIFGRNSPEDWSDKNSLVAKFNYEGENQWLRTIDTGVDDNFAQGGVVDSSDGSLYVTGSSNLTSTNTYKSALTVKLDTDGALLWSRALTGTDSGSSSRMALDSSGNVYIVGTTQTNSTLLAKYNSSGTLQWTKSYDYGNSGTYLAGIAINSSDEIYCVGAGKDSGAGSGEHYSIIHKYDTSGNLSFQKSYGLNIGMSNIKFDSSGNFYVIGSHGSTSAIGYRDGFIAKFNSSGVLQWDRTFGKFSSSYNITFSFSGIDIDSSDNIFISASEYFYLSGARSPGWVLKYNTGGTLQWAHRFYPVDNGNENYSPAYGIKVRNQIIFLTGKYGYDEEDIFVLKIPKDGSLPEDAYTDAGPYPFWYTKPTINSGSSPSEASLGFSVSTTTKTTSTAPSGSTPTISNEPSTGYTVNLYPLTE